MKSQLLLLLLVGTCGLLLTPRRSSRSPVDLSALDVKKAVDFIHERLVLSEIVSQYVEVRQNGPSSFICTCPFHSDTNPSMGVSDDKGLYHCFSCGAGGDAIKFVREIEHLSFIEAIVKTLSLGGITNSSEEFGLGGSNSSSAGLKLSSQEAAIFRMRTRIELAMQKAADFYAARLLADPKAGGARSHLISRRIRPQTAFKYQLGYAPVGGPFSLTANLTAEGFTIDELVIAGLTVKGDRNRTMPGVVQQKNPNAENNFDRFRDRLIVPIRNTQGAVVAFGGRLLEPSTSSKPKYLNSPETPIFKKSSTLFGFDIARKAMSAEGMAVVVEGYLDVVALHDVGVETAVAAMGTMMTKDQLESAARAGKGKVVLLFDADEAGQLATQRIIEQILPQVPSAGNIAIDLRVASLPPVVKKKAEDKDPKDPADVCLTLGNSAGPAFRSAITQAVGWKQWCADRIILNGLREVEELAKKGGKSFKEQPGVASSSPMMSVLGLDGASFVRPPPTATIANLVASPDILSRTAEALSRFLGTLTDADRTILAYYCAERLAGDRASLRLQLETDLLTGAKRHATFKERIGGKRVTELPLEKPVSLAEASPSTSSPTQRLTTSSRVVIGTSDNAESQIPATMKQKPRHPVSSSYSVTPILRSTGLQAPRRAMQPEYFQASGPPVSDGLVEDANDVEELLAEVGLELTNIEERETLDARTRWLSLYSKTWQDVVLHERRPMMLSVSAANGRVFGAEQELLKSFVKFPALRSAVKAAYNRIISLPGPEQAWSTSANKDLWGALLDVDSEGDDYLVRVQQSLPPSSDAFNLLVNFSSDDASDGFGHGEDVFKREYAVAAATQAICEWRLKTHQVARVGVGYQAGSAAGDEEETLTLESLMSNQRLVEMYESEERKAKLDNMQMLSGKDKSEFLELLKRHRESSDDDDYYEKRIDESLRIDGDGVTNKYTFAFAQSDERVLTAGEISEEERINLERHQLADESARNDARRKGGKIAGFTIGLDHEEEAPKWRKRQ